MSIEELKQRAEEAENEFDAAQKQVQIKQALADAAWAAYLIATCPFQVGDIITKKEQWIPYDYRVIQIRVETDISRITGNKWFTVIEVAAVTPGGAIIQNKAPFTIRHIDHWEKVNID